jgi:hypothetical protein
LDEKYKELFNCEMAHFDIKPKFALPNTLIPYREPIETLQKTMQLNTPEQKMATYLKVTKDIINSIEQDFKTAKISQNPQ